LDAIEKAVRNALDKGEAEDKNYRRRVYVSARSALEKSMSGRKLTQDMVDQRFSRLAEVAAMIESEFTPATEEFEYPVPGRRSYEAAAPVVEELPQPDAEAASGEEGSATPPEAATSQEGAPRKSELSVESYPEPDLEPEVSTAAEPAAFNEHLPEDEPEAKWIAPEVDAPEVVTPVRADDESEPAQPRKRKASSRKNARVLTSIITEAEPVVPAPDLFQGSEPVWDNVVLSEPEMSGPDEVHAFELTAPDHTLLDELTQDKLQTQENAAVHEAERPGDIPDLFEDAAVPQKTSQLAEPAADEMNVTGHNQEPGTEPQSSQEPANEVEESTHDSSASFDRDPASDDARAMKDSDLSSPVLEEEPQFEVRPIAVTAQTVSQKEAAENAKRALDGSEPKRGWAFLFILVTLLAFLIMGLWVAYTTGSLKLRSESDTPVEDVVSIAPQDAPAPGSAPVPAAAPAENDWLMIFRPDNPGDLVVDPTIKAELAGSGPLAHLRIEPAASSGAESAVIFSIGKGILEQIAGKSAVFDIVAAADDNNPTQISVLCDFAGLGDCGRKRYRIDAATSDNLFQIEFPEGAPAGDGQVIINPDVDGKGRSLEIYAIKVRIADK
jgi:hypothetical protein